MDINGFKKTKKGGDVIKSKSDPLIRTMQDDVLALDKNGENKKVSPPDGLPVGESIFESIQNSELKAQQEEKAKIAAEKERRAREEAEKQRLLREEAERQRIIAQREARMKVNRDIERQKELIEKVKKERIKAEREEAERRKELIIKAEKERIKAEEEARKRAEEEAKKQEEERIKAEEEAKKQEEERIKAEKKIQRQNKIKEIKLKLVRSTPKLIFGLMIIFLVIGTGAFFYWWNYVRVVPVPVIVTHFECQSEKCVEVTGEGESKCSIDNDCKPIEPIVPEKLIPLAEIETIELPVENYESFLSKLESIFVTKQKEGLFKVILTKLMKQEGKEYADFNSFLVVSKINFPEDIRSAVDSDNNINGNNYNLFLYNNGEENRAGLIVKMGESSSLINDLKNWESTIFNDVRSIIFENKELEPATEEFQDNIYNGIAMRYINFPTPDLSIDYAIIDGKLIITTSKDSMYAIIDALVPMDSIE